ncbi:MAG: endolytic transglycosylase MltG [Sphingobacteriia bacterium]|nr:endolytic transglycosylase MltG [Sphingobacteriia bacterium]
MNPKTKKSFARTVALISLILILALGIAGFAVYKTIFGNNTTLEKEQAGYLYLKTGSSYTDLLVSVQNSGLLKNFRTFKLVADRKNLGKHVHAGLYEILSGMSNNDIVNLLRSGKQKPVNVIFNNITFPVQLAGVVSRQIEADSVSLIRLFHNETFLKKYGLTPATAPAMFIPNTYEFYWNTRAEEFFSRMHTEYKKFWTTKRKLQAELLNLNPLEISIIASIVEKETSQNDEKARIAGVYLNRLKRGWKLQADPTTVYAIYLETGSMPRRVLRNHTQLESPYNTYFFKGLPPGPICMPSVASIDAVLNSEKHNYMFFVASPDGSGYHRFSASYSQHLIYAREYQKALNKLQLN